MGWQSLFPVAPDEFGTGNLGGLVPCRGKLRSPPLCENLDAVRASDLGVYVTGYREDVLVVTAGWVGTLRNDVQLMATLGGRTEAYDVPRPLTGLDKYTWAAIGGKLYGTHGGNVIQFDPTTFSFEPVTFAVGPEGATRSYLLEPLRAGCVVSWQGRLWYGDLRPQSLAASAVVDPDTLTDNSPLVGGRWAYQKNHVVWSDPYRPGSVQVRSFVGLEDSDARVMALVPVGEGQDSALLIMADRGLWMLQGYDASTRALTNVTRDVGCVAPRSVVSKAGTVFWMGPDGFYRWSLSEGIARIGNFERYWRHESDMFGNLDWEPETGAVAAIGSVYPYMAVTSAKHKSILVIDLATQTGGVYSLANAPEVLTNLGTSGLMSSEMDLLVGRLGALDVLRWDAPPATAQSYTVLGPFEVNGDQTTIKNLRVRANLNSGVLGLMLFSGEEAHNFIISSGGVLSQVNSGPWLWNGSQSMENGESDQCARFLPAATTATTPKFLAGTADPPTTEWPRFISNVVCTWDVSVNTVVGRNFYLFLTFTPQSEPLKLYDLKVETA